MKQTERIMQYEALFDEASEAVRELEKAIANWREAQEKIAALDAYYRREWRSDFEADEAGKLPADLKRGVLSEDGLYDLLEENAELIRKLNEE